MDGPARCAPVYDVEPQILRLSKALGEDTRFAIFQHIAAAEEPQTVRDLVSTFGMHHSAIRIHLGKLEEAGLIVSQKKHTPGAVGRPQLAFVPNPAATEITLPPRNYQLLARLALDYAAAGHGMNGSPEDFGVSWGRAHVRDLRRPSDGPLPLDEALKTLTELLQQMRSTPSIVSSNGDGHVLTDRNCLFGGLSASYEPTVCVLHQAVMRGMLDELSIQPFEWEPRERIAAGDEQCCVHIRPVDGA